MPRSAPERSLRGELAKGGKPADERGPNGRAACRFWRGATVKKGRESTEVRESTRVAFWDVNKKGVVSIENKHWNNRAISPLELPSLKTDLRRLPKRRLAGFPGGVRGGATGVRKGFF